MFERVIRIFIALCCFLVFATGDSHVIAKSNRSTPQTSSAVRIAKGKNLYQLNCCSDCHRVENIADSDKVSLHGVALRRTRTFVINQLLDPENHVRKHMKEFNGDPNLMPYPNLDKNEAALIADYLMSLRSPHHLPARKPN